ncbi:MAG: ribonuclease E/G [Lachnospiraceae bacterium]|nr:ribonuclease E/G [Lachnospiraceae bacterium]
MIRSTVCITEYKNDFVAWLDVDSKMERLSVTVPDSDITGNIYVGRIKHVVKNLKACFVEFKEDTLGFLSFNDINDDIRPVEGTELIVQVVKEASKNKEAVLTSKPSISGIYCAVTLEKPSVNISRKITGDMRASLREAIPKDDECSVTIRTNALYAKEPALIEDEAKRLYEKLKKLKEVSETRKAPSLIYKKEPEYINFIKGLPLESYERILTDIPEVFENIKEYGNAVLYSDDYPLAKLYSLDTKLEEIMSERIWLKCGGNIVIQYTEAMTVIDVNSAKNISGKDRDENILLINREAAEQIARQLRLRNISGIIIVDFINMHTDEAKNELIEHIKSLLLTDPVRCDYVDMTSLGLVEIVRKKIKPPIYEILRQ